MMALYHRQATGEGQHVEGALLPTALMMSNAMLIERDLLQVDKPRMGNRGTSVAPCDLYRGRRRLGAGAGRRPADVQAVVPPGRPRGPVRRSPLRRRRPALGARRRAQRPHAGVVRRPGPRPRCWPLLEAAKLPAAPLHSPQEVARRPARARPWATSQRVPTSPVRPVRCRSSRRRSGCRRRRARSAAGRRCSGEHTDEILGEIGYDADEIADLRAREIV